MDRISAPGGGGGMEAHNEGPTIAEAGPAHKWGQAGRRSWAHGIVVPKIKYVVVTG